MKNKYLGLLLLFITTVINVQAQDKFDHFDHNQLYLTYNKQNIKFDDIKKSSVIRLLGKPIKITKEKGEDDIIRITYIYKNGDIVFEGNNAASYIEIIKNGWAFSLKTGSTFKTYLPGSDAHELTKLYPHSWDHQSNSIQIPIVFKKTYTESSMLFEMTGSTVKAISLILDES